MFVMFLSARLAASGTLQGPILRCEEDPKLGNTILLMREPSHPDNWLRLVEFSFPATGWLRPVDSCRAWVISTLETGNIDWNRISLVKLLASKSNEARISLTDASELYRACSESDRCAMNIPYRWHWSLWGDFFYKKNMTLPQFCYEQPERHKKSSLPTAYFEQNVYENLGLVSSWSEPGSNLTSEIIKATANMHDETIVISTMQWSPSQLKLLKNHFSTRKIRAYVLGDLEVWLSGKTREPIELSKLSDDQFLIIPAFETPRHARSSHHIKGAVIANKNGDFLFTSSNLTSGDDSPLLEFGIHGRSREFSADWFDVVHELVSEYCAERNKLACIMPQYTTGTDLANLGLEEILARGCRSFFEDAKLKRFYSERPQKNRIVTARIFNVQDTILKFLDSAKASVKATVNQISDKQIIQSFEGATTIPRSLYIGKAITNDSNTPKELDRPNNNHIYLGNKLPHSKAILIDDTKLLWGTGNFTATGLRNQREMFFFTSDQRVIQTFKNFFNQFPNDT
jgi:hypothetical protein